MRIAMRLASFGETLVGEGNTVITDEGDVIISVHTDDDDGQVTALVLHPPQAVALARNLLRHARKGIRMKYRSRS